MKTLTFTSYSPDRFAALQAALALKGLNLSGNQGQVRDFGAVVFYDYNSEQQELTIDIQSPPHFHSMDSFVMELSKAINATV